MISIRGLFRPARKHWSPDVQLHHDSKGTSLQERVIQILMDSERKAFVNEPCQVRMLRQWQSIAPTMGEKVSHGFPFKMTFLESLSP